jgi:hypothetical protein
MFRGETDKLVATRAAAGKPVERIHLKGHSHISETYAVGTGDRSLSGPVLEFVRRVTGRASGLHDSEKKKARPFGRAF